jgi:DNA repair exonuclease SbcCD ATPase subunit
MENLRIWLNGNKDYASGAKIYLELGTDPLLKRMFSEPESEFKKKKLILALEYIWKGRNGAQIPTSPKKSTAVPQSPPVLKIEKELDELKKEVKDLEELNGEKESTIEDLEWEKEELEQANEDLQEENKLLRNKKLKNGWPVTMSPTLEALHAQWKPKFLTMVDLMSRLYEVARAGMKNKSKQKEAGQMALRILDLREEVIDIYKKRDHYLVTGELPEDPPPVAECIDEKLWPVSLQNAQRYVRDYKSKLKNMDPSSPKYLKTLGQMQKWEAEVEKYKKLLKRNE